MGCDPWNNNSLDSCIAYQPGTGDGVSVEFTEHPLNAIRSNGAYNIPDREGIAVMYPSIILTGNPVVNNSSSNCGKVTRAVPTNSQLCPGNNPCMFVYDYYPEELSFDYGFSDTWFSYLYDTSNEQGIIGKPCYYYESSSAVTSDGDPANDNTVSGGNCIPCTNFTCDPATTTLTYTIDEESLTGDPDCPHPTLFGIGTGSNKLVFSYDSLSTTVPNGVTDFSFSYDGVTYADAWNQLEVSGFDYTSTQNPYQSGDEAFDDFTVFEINDIPNNKTGLRIKIETSSIYDDSGASTVFTGTKWLATEILNPGTGYAVNDVFALTYTHTHPDNTQTVLTMNLKVTGVGPSNAVGNASGFDILRSGDTLNGHTITRAVHTDLDNFPYHIIYLDGNGSDFTKNTQYTSNRNHVVTAQAGYGIKDRAILVGMYEYLEKSYQFTTADLDKNAPDQYNSLVQPDVTVTITNGIVTNLTIVDGGSGWTRANLGRDPEVIITAPTIASGTTATAKSEFTNGVLTAIKVDTGGTGYSSTNLPQVVVTNVHKRETAQFANQIVQGDLTDRSDIITNAFPDGEVGFSSDDKTKIATQIAAIDDTTTVQVEAPNIRLKLDPERKRVHEMPQRMYSKKNTEPFKAETAIKYSLDYLDKVEVSRDYKDIFNEEKGRSAQHRLDDIAAVTQEQIPSYEKYDESFVETVQGPTSSLPFASTYTKYLIKQYRPDPKPVTNLQITLSCSPVTPGCAHFVCSTPSGTSGGTVNNGDGTTTTTSYTMSGLLGEGCKAWTASGSLTMWNDMSASTRQYADAVKAFGNPFNVT